MNMETLEFKDLKTTPDLIFPYTDLIKNSGVPIVIDNGSYNCRVGWASSEKPQLIFKNILAKPRKERSKKDTDMQIGNDIANIEAVRFLLKTQFDRNIITHYEVQENIFNYSFSHLGIDTEGCVNHPIVITEAYANPNHCRMLMSELLFECYNVPSVYYGVDSLLSFKRSALDQTGLVIGLGYHCTHVIPVVHGMAVHRYSRRLDFGGNHITYYMFKLMQLKYPAHLTAITLSRAEELVHDHCHIAKDYMEELGHWSDADYYDMNVLCIQLANTNQAAQPGITSEQQKEKKRELTRKLIEINARKREEKLAEDEEQLSQLMAIQDLQEEGDEEEFQTALKEFGLGSSDDLPKIINQIQARIEKTRQKIVAANTAPEESSMTEDPKQKVVKFTTPKEEEDFKSWVADICKKRDDILERRAVRRQKRLEMVKRRTPAAVERMRLISQLARNEKRDDDFGLRDEDWDIYKAINKDGGESDSDGESEKLLELEGALRAAGWSSLEEARRLHVGVERLRVAELLFQPSLIGSDQMGLSELAALVIGQFPPEIAENLAANVVLTGGPSQLPGLVERLQADLTAARPFRSRVSVSACPEPSLAPWLTLRDLALSVPLITRQDYLEKGGEYLREHPTSNAYTPSPVPLVQNTSLPIADEIELDIL